jgi:hypothetical protein
MIAPPVRARQLTTAQIVGKIVSSAETGPCSADMVSVMESVITDACAGPSLTGAARPTETG